MKLKVVDIKSPILRRKAKVVQRVDKKILQFISDMKETLAEQKDPEGVGLAAPQVGKSLRIFIMDYGQYKMMAVINPVVLDRSEKKSVKKTKDEKILEGCLSMPHYYGPVKRHDGIKIQFLNEEGSIQVKSFRGFPAQIVGHEIDHLEGILFIDHILTQKSKLYEIHDSEVEEIEI